MAGSRNITFVLPASGRQPSGGFRIVYEHANRLARSGHKIHLVHVAEFGDTTILRSVRLLARFTRSLYSANRDRARWFALDDRISISYQFRARPDGIPDADVTIATGWRTAAFVAALPPRCGDGAYFIQSYEDWDGPKDQVDASWRLPLKRLVISEWLMRIAADFGLDATLVPNAIDHDQFYLTAPLEHRSATKILFPSLPKQIKGSRDVVRALNVLQKEGLAFDVTAFGRVDPAEFGLEGDYVYEPDPSQDVLRGLYNGAGVFVNASLIEGWGLTIAEAAACGAALVVSDIGGHRELASPDNALLFAPGAVDQIAARLRRLRAEPHLREKLARLAMVDVTQYNWERASAAMSRALAL